VDELDVAVASERVIERPIRGVQAFARSSHADHDSIVGHPAVGVSWAQRAGHRLPVAYSVEM
jgi:hypothetical protein